MAPARCRLAVMTSAFTAAVHSALLGLKPMPPSSARTTLQKNCGSAEP